MPVSAKICGLSTPETIHAAIEAGASHVGFVFFGKSPRNVAPDQAAALASHVPSHVASVGLFVNPDAEYLADVLDRVPLDMIQLHGNEMPAFCARIRETHRRPVWKAVPIRTRADLAAGEAYRGAVDRLLYDAKPPEGAALPGGNGLRFDWKLLDGFSHPLPWVLSGGLDPANIAEAVRVTRATIVDVSSGVESAPGIKDVDKIAAFLHAIAAS